ncbi:23S rRNA (guanosine-2'-O-)-methyltransferase RlmB [Novimethylophilus kurashikiensis]|uniref:23S rRNA (Guanosine-2'-O-)-methyltransferase RlmB n=1 Tax=Novimethylophilus kurashikiensis TaxID=1825523 RepID=A0A2R5F8Y9_9PROT|nr:ligand-binding protein SH3 [Novimethylophilus kurashikiensis]GBG14008.1 23S rRNA (guanosine-2'-O-)-methyltransferase RlmB [Novimethylophilus kurashikiensis]
MAYTLLFLSACMSALASVMIKLAGQTQFAWGWDWQSLMSRPVFLIVGALGAYCFGFLFYAVALKKLELSIAYPIMVAATILLIYGYGLLRGESINMQSLAGAGLMIFSIFLIYSR